MLPTTIQHQIPTLSMTLIHSINSTSNLPPTKSPPQPNPLPQNSRLPYQQPTSKIPSTRPLPFSSAHSTSSPTKPNPKSILQSRYHNPNQLSCQHNPTQPNPSSTKPPISPKRQQLKSPFQQPPIPQTRPSTAVSINLKYPTPPYPIDPSTATHALYPKKKQHPHSIQSRSPSPKIPPNPPKFSHPLGTMIPSKANTAKEL